jgi:dedicator of cytokinesis protein 1
MIAKLDSLVEGGSGDHQFKDLFNSLLSNMSEKHSTMSTQVCPKANQWQFF